MNCFSRDQSLSDLYVAQKEKRAMATTTAVVGQHSRVTVPSYVVDFALLPAQRLLAGYSFIVRCHVTSK